MLAEWMMKATALKRATKLRHIYYAQVLRISQADIRKTINDIAITLHHHPLSLGVTSEADARLYMAPSKQIEVLVVDNTWSAAESHKNRKAWRDGEASVRKVILGRDSTINSHIVKMKVVGGVKAVIVTEHRNLDVESEWFQRNMHHSIVVMVSSFLFRDHHAH